MLLSEFGLNVLAGWVANKFNQVVDVLMGKSGEKALKNEQQVSQSIPDLEENPKLFCTFDVYMDLEEILQRLSKPVAYILIEKEPTSVWNLTCLVVEEKVTGEWYLFHRGRMAAQGMEVEFVTLK